MKLHTYIIKKIIVPFSMMGVLFTSCERDISDDAQEATFPNIAEIYTDTFVAMGSDFYFPFAGAKPDVFSVDENEGFQSNSSIRIDVPNATDPSGNFAGAIFRMDGAGRDLTAYNALTFYIRASSGVTISELGFGLDFEGDRFRVATTNTSVGTSWQKVIIPIPDASKLTQERGMFWFSDGTQETEGLGYTFWVDELKFEKLNTIAQPRPVILDGNDSAEDIFIGTPTTIGGLNETFNLPNGQDIVLSVAPSFYEFTSSDESIATISDLGVVNALTEGNTTITAKVGGINAAGSLIVTSLNTLDINEATPPTRNAEDVASIYGDTYTSATSINFDPRFGGSTTIAREIPINKGKVLSFRNNNFTGILFTDTVDASELGFLHVDVYVEDPSTSVGIEIRDIGANGVLNTNELNGQPSEDDKDYRATLNGFQAGVWKSFDIPLVGDLANQKDNLGAIILTGGNYFILDNIYFYKSAVSNTPTEPQASAPAPTHTAANVISLFSNTYTNVPVTTFRTNWSNGTLENFTIGNDNINKYSSLDFVGIETTGANTVDVSSMTHFHIDVWSADFTEFKIKLVDFGADGGFQGGDDKEHELIFATPNQGEWISYDIPLTDFVGLTTKEHIAQYILAAGPSGSTTVFVDNMYFYKQ